MNSGRPTGICRQTAASGGAAEAGGIQSETETDREGSVTAAGAHRGLRGPTAGERATGRGAGAERGGRHNSIGRRNGRPGPDTATGGATGI